MDAATTYGVVKALHVIFMVTFFAGTFYIVRLFIYHKEAERKWEPDRSVLIAQFAVMERRLWYGITWPSAILMLGFGVWLLVLNPALLRQPFMHAKLGLVGLLLVYHLINQRLYTQLRKKNLRWGAFGLRLWNEGATLVLFGVVFLIMLRDRVGWAGGIIGLILLTTALAAGIGLYRRKREKTNAESGHKGTTPGTA
jgi:protoporphyrinogen IX oxidase